jgi:RNA polymerase sigma-70 factor (ECF subfamily)
MEIDMSKRDPLPAVDEEIVQALAAGEQNAWRELIAQHSGRLGAIIWRIGGESVTREDVEEAVADTFFAFWQRVDRYDPTKGSLGKWLNHLARYQALSLRRRKWRKEDTLGETLAEEGSFLEETLNRLAAEQVLQSRIQPLLDSLPPIDRTILQMRFSEGISPKEIAAKLGITPNVARIRLHRTLKLLREKLSSINGRDSS